LEHNNFRNHDCLSILTDDSRANFTRNCISTCSPILARSVYTKLRKKDSRVRQGKEITIRPVQRGGRGRYICCGIYGIQFEFHVAALQHAWYKTPAEGTRTCIQESHVLGISSAWSTFSRSKFFRFAPTSAACIRLSGTYRRTDPLWRDPKRVRKF